MTDQIRDNRKPGWYWINSELVKRDGNVLGVNAIAIYNVLATFANNETGQAWPSVPTISSLCNLSDKPIRNALKRLEQAGWITIEARKSEDGSANLSNLYTLLPVPDSTALKAVPPLKKRGRANSTGELKEKNKKNASASHGEFWEASLYYLFGIVWEKGMDKTDITGDQGGVSNRYAWWFREKTSLTPSEIIAFRDWWLANKPRMTIPQKYDAILMQIAQWQAAPTSSTYTPTPDTVVHSLPPAKG